MPVQDCPNGTIVDENGCTVCKEETCPAETPVPCSLNGESWCCAEENTCGNTAGQCCLGGKCCGYNEIPFCSEKKVTNNTCVNYSCCDGVVNYYGNDEFNEDLYGVCCPKGTTYHPGYICHGDSYPENCCSVPTPDGQGTMYDGGCC